MTPRSPAPPTATGLPRSVGSSSTSTDAKNASRSTCRIGASSTVGLLEDEFNAAKGLTVGDADGTAGLLGPLEDDVANGARVASELGGVSEDGLHLGVDGARHVSDHVRFVRTAQQQHTH